MYIIMESVQVGLGGGGKSLGDKATLKVWLVLDQSWCIQIANPFYFCLPEVGDQIKLLASRRNGLVWLADPSSNKMLHVPLFFVSRLETFDADVRSLVTEYKALPAVAQNEEILGSFERMWESGREKLALRLGRSMKWQEMYSQFHVWMHMLFDYCT